MTSDWKTTEHVVMSQLVKPTGFTTHQSINQVRLGGAIRPSGTSVDRLYIYDEDPLSGVRKTLLQIEFMNVCASKE